MALALALVLATVSRPMQGPRTPVSPSPQMLQVFQPMPRGLAANWPGVGSPQEQGAVVPQL